MFWLLLPCLHTPPPGSGDDDNDDVGIEAFGFVSRKWASPKLSLPFTLTSLFESSKPYPISTSTPRPPNRKSLKRDTRKRGGQETSTYGGKFKPRRKRGTTEDKIFYYPLLVVANRLRIILIVKGVTYAEFDFLSEDIYDAMRAVRCDFTRSHS